MVLLTIPAKNWPSTPGASCTPDPADHKSLAMAELCTRSAAQKMLATAAITRLENPGMIGRARV
jgi:hypothetical protein